VTTYSPALLAVAPEGCALAADIPQMIEGAASKSRRRGTPG
jgi:hypothetical protein